MHKSERKLGDNWCQCNDCGEYFDGVFAFDKHRVGEWDERTCLTPDEMRAKGMTANSTGWWISSARDADADAVSSVTLAQISASEAVG